MTTFGTPVTGGARSGDGRSLNGSAAGSVVVGASGVSCVLASCLRKRRAPSRRCSSELFFLAAGGSLSTSTSRLPRSVGAEGSAAGVGAAGAGVVEAGAGVAVVDP